MSRPSHAAATHLDIERLLGPLEPDTAMAVMALAPTLEEIEKAALHVAGNGETLPERHQPHGTVLAIVELFTRNDEDERRVP